MINKIPTYLIMTMFIHVYISGLVDSTCRPQCKPVLFILARYHGGVGPTVEYLWSVGVTRGPHFSRDSDQITNDPSSGPTQIEKSPVCSLLELYAYICALLLRYIFWGMGGGVHKYNSKECVSQAIDALLKTGLT